jgi:hypoxanthine phosphoribosyltransferase
MTDEDWLEWGTFTSHSGEALGWKIKAHKFSPAVVEVFAKLIKNRIGFTDVIGIPTGGLPLAQALEKYRVRRDQPGITVTPTLLIVDDVYTTGFSMEEARVDAARSGKFKFSKIRGAVMFTRDRLPNWIYPVFSYLPPSTGDWNA